MVRVAIVDESSDLSAALPHLLGGSPDLSITGPIEPRALGEASPDVVFVNLDAGRPGSESVLTQVIERTAAPVVGLTAVLSVDRIRKGFRAGAFDVIGLPPRAAEVSDAFLRARAASARAPLPAADESEGCGLIGVSSAMEKLREDIVRVAATPVTVLIQGESGVGKELVARAIHDHSNRSDRTFEARNCGAFHQDLFEGEIFGTEKGAYTGACERQGACELAHRGTLFLDEVGELLPAHQVKLLRLIELGVYHRLGGVRERHTDVRLVSASNRNLGEAVEAGHFRSDLFYRLNIFPITVPPLRERPDDIPLLARHFAKQGVGPCGVCLYPPEGSGREVDSGALEKLAGHRWPGNVRELRNVMQRAVLCAEEPVIRSRDIWFA